MHEQEAPPQRTTCSTRARSCPRSLVNDHDPKPLRYRLLAERPGQLAWEYLEQGPEVWRVRLGRRANRPPPTMC